MIPTAPVLVPYPSGNVRELFLLKPRYFLAKTPFLKGNLSCFRRSMQKVHMLQHQEDLHCAYQQLHAQSMWSTFL